MRKINLTMIMVFFGVFTLSPNTSIKKDIKKESLKSAIQYQKAVDEFVNQK